MRPTVAPTSCRAGCMRQGAWECRRHSRWSAMRLVGGADAWGGAEGGRKVLYNSVGGANIRVKSWYQSSGDAAVVVVLGWQW